MQECGCSAADRPGMPAVHVLRLRATAAEEAYSSALLIDVTSSSTLVPFLRQLVTVM
jgi:hypothetical protein